MMPSAKRSRHFQMSSSVFLFMLFSIWCLPSIADADNGCRKLINCDLHDGVCTNRIGDIDVRLEVAPRPVRAMKDLAFTVTLSGNNAAPTALPYIDLSMPGMDMGPNRVKMKPVGKNVYEGMGVIVKCPSGHRVWAATVMVPDIGKTEFIFDVIY